MSEMQIELMSGARTEPTVLAVKGLQTVFFTNSGLFKAVDDVSFRVRRGETLAIVGESGCGKSVTALSIMRLVPEPPGRIVGGSVMLEGKDLLALDETRMREIRGNRISMIFQEPMTSLNPVMRIGDQITEAVRLHREMSRKEGRGSGCCHLVRQPKTPLYARVDGLDPERALARGELGRAAGGNSRHGAVIDHPATRLRVRAAL